MTFLTALQKIQDIVELTDTDVEEDSTVIHQAKRARTEGNTNQVLRRTGKAFNYFGGELAKRYVP